MDFAGPSKTIETVETLESILFRVIPHRRWIDILMVGAVIIGFLSMAVFREQIVEKLIGLLGAVLLAFHFVQPQKIQSLRVTRDDLISSEAGALRWNHLYAITYNCGGEDVPAGLYAEGVRGKNCLLQLNEEQTLTILTAIYSKFPYPDLLPPEPNSLETIFESIRNLGENALVSLNLSRPKDPKA